MTTQDLPFFANALHPRCQLIVCRLLNVSRPVLPVAPPPSRTAAAPDGGRAVPGRGRRLGDLHGHGGDAAAATAAAGPAGAVLGGEGQPDDGRPAQLQDAVGLHGQARHGDPPSQGQVRGEERM